MSQSRDFGPMATQMRTALDRYTKEELIDLMTHLVRVYVLEETQPHTPDVSQPKAAEDLVGLSFPQLLLHLQMSLPHDELGRFRVSGNDVFVTLGEAEHNFLNPSTVAAAESAAPKRVGTRRATAPSPDPEPAPEPPPSNPVTKEEDFEFDQIERPGDREEPKRPAPPTPAPRSATPSRADALFGGGGRSPGLRSAPPPPPPIADSAPGDPSKDEVRAARQRSPSGGSDNLDVGAGGARPGFEDAPALADGDTEIKSSNRFADLELD